MFSWECLNFLKQQKQPPEVFCKRNVLKTFTIFTRKHLCWSLFGVFGVNFTKKKLQHRYFPVNITKFLRTLFLQDTSGGCFYCFKKSEHSHENISGGNLIHLTPILKNIWKRLQLKQLF